MNTAAERLARRTVIDTVALGDLVKVNGTLRVVRSVNRSPRRGWVQSISFAIRRCSWTTRPYTVLNRCDLSAKPFEIVKRGNHIGASEVERMLQDDIDSKSRHFKCCDVVGVIS